MSHPRLENLDRFQNNPKEYRSNEESFVARGKHLNKIRDKINEIIDQHIEYHTGSLTDGAPTDAEIEAALGITAEQAGEGYAAYIKDTTGAGNIFFVITDGTNWWYNVLSPTLT